MNTSNEIQSTRVINSANFEAVDSNQNLMEETIQCLLKAFTEKNNSERQIAENRLRELGNFYINYKREMF